MKPAMIAILATAATATAGEMHATTVDVSRITSAMTNLVLYSEHASTNGAAWITCEYTNALSARLTNSPLEGQALTNHVNELVKSGKVCQVIGHKWVNGCGEFGCTIINPHKARRCSVCEKVETQEPGVWK